jgi:hypothetical protein
MNDNRRVRWTRALVLTGIVLSYLSYGTSRLGGGELYPFADWRLYSAPIGINEPASTFRIYTDDGAGKWQRQAIEPSRLYTRKEYLYVLHFWTARVLDDPAGTTDAVRRLMVATESLEPGASDYRIVAESYYSLPLFSDPSLYDTSTVVRFTR